MRWWSLLGVVLGLASAATAAGVPATPLTIPADARVLVVAPHPDDETIAVGGLLYRLERAHVPVRVVFVTNGDGYHDAVTRVVPAHAPTSADYLAFGRRREDEAIAALAQLGVPRQDIRFLGFPDGGLEALWRGHWARAYTSPYTREDRPPYRGNPSVEYEGRDLTGVLKNVMRAFRPTVVIMPHPYDRHPDHVHSSYFVTEAVSELQGQGVLPARLPLLTYLVHYPRWPLFVGAAGDRIAPTPEVADTTWLTDELTPDEIAAKRAALAVYQTQLNVMGGFLRSFVCRNELLGTVDGQLLARIARVH